MVRKFRAFCLRESVRDCAGLCASCIWKWASARYAPLSCAPLPFSLTDHQSTLSNLRSCCFFHILTFCSLLYVLFFFERLFSLRGDWVALSIATVIFSAAASRATVRPMCLASEWKREQESVSAHVMVCACSLNAKKNIGNPTHTRTEFYTSALTHRNVCTYIYTLLSLKIKFLLKYVKNSILKCALFYTTSVEHYFALHINVDALQL